MSAKLNPYISFRDTAKDALEFYRTVFGGDLTVTTFGEGGMPHEPAEADRVMHGQLDAPDGMVLMAADTPSGMDHTPGGAITIALFGDEHDRLSGYWDALSDGGTVQMQLAQAPWGDTYGMCVDRFGVGWQVNIMGSAAG